MPLNSDNILELRSIEIDETKAKSIIKEYKDNNIHGLHLIDVNFTEDGASIFAEMGFNKLSLTRPDSDNSKFQGSTITIILNYLTEYEPLQELNLNIYNFQDYEVDSILKYLKNTSSLKKFELASDNYKAILCEILQLLEQHKSLEELSLHNAELYDTENLFFICFFQKNLSLKKLNLPGSIWADEVFTSFLNVLIDYPALEELDLSGAYFNLTILANYLAKNPPLKKLNVSITKESILDILTALKQNHTLEELYLDGRNLNDNLKHNYTLLEEYITENTSLKKLHFSSLNQPAILTYISRALEHSRSVEELELRDCSFHEKDASSFADFLKKNISLKKLNLSKLRLNTIYTEYTPTLETIQRGLKDNTSIDELLITKPGKEKGWLNFLNENTKLRKLSYNNSDSEVISIDEINILANNKSLTDLYLGRVSIEDVKTLLMGLQENEFLQALSFNTQSILPNESLQLLQYLSHFLGKNNTLKRFHFNGYVANLGQYQETFETALLSSLNDNDCLEELILPPSLYINLQPETKLQIQEKLNKNKYANTTKSARSADPSQKVLPTESPVAASKDLPLITVLSQEQKDNLPSNPDKNHLLKFFAGKPFAITGILVSSFFAATLLTVLLTATFTMPLILPCAAFTLILGFFAAAMNVLAIHQFAKNDIEKEHTNLQSK